MSLASVRWSGFYGVELPVSEQAGPYDTSGGVAAGFAHTPLGALLAAVNMGSARTRSGVRGSSPR